MIKKLDTNPSNFTAVNPLKTAYEKNWSTESHKCSGNYENYEKIMVRK